MKKYIRLVSDLHLEAWLGSRTEFLFSSFIKPFDKDDDSILVLAGDISSNTEQLLEFLQEAVKRFEHVVYVPGNHELYRKNFTVWNEKMRGLLATIPGLTATTADTTAVQVVGGVRFILSTMWADGGITPFEAYDVGRSLNDFRLITKGSENFRFTVDDMRIEYNKARDLIAAALNEPFSGTTVVVTHHLPSRKLVAERFLASDGSDGINGGFVGDCTKILESDNAPDLWLHGHTHDRISKTLGKTRIECNPTGYRGEWSNGFVGGKPVYINLAAPDFSAEEERG